MCLVNKKKDDVQDVESATPGSTEEQSSRCSLFVPNGGKRRGEKLQFAYKQLGKRIRLKTFQSGLLWSRPLKQVALALALLLPALGLVYSASFMHEGVVVNYVSDCDAYLSGSSSFDRAGAAAAALSQRNKWLFGYSTRLVANDAKYHLEEISIGHGMEGSGEDSITVRRGDLILLCLHSLPSQTSTETQSDASSSEVKEHEVPFVETFTLTDESRVRLRNGMLLVGVMGARYAPDAIHGKEYETLDMGPSVR